MTHELDKLDEFLGTERGTAHKVIILHHAPSLINQKLSKFNIILDNFGMVPRQQRQQWKKLMQEVGISSRYWKDGLPIPDAVVPILEEQ